MTSNPSDAQDIVERLREKGELHFSLPVLNEAADEIERLRAALQQSRSAVVEECAAKADAGVQQAREAIAQCKKWSAAQGEWSRARDLGLDIADAIRALSQESADERLA